MQATRRLEIKAKELDRNECAQRHRVGTAELAWQHAKKALNERRSQLDAALSLSARVAKGSQEGRGGTCALGSALELLKSRLKSCRKAEGEERCSEAKLNEEASILERIQLRQQRVGELCEEAKFAVRAHAEQLEHASASEMGLAQVALGQAGMGPQPLAAIALHSPLPSLATQSMPAPTTEASPRSLEAALVSRIREYAASASQEVSRFKCNFETPAGNQVQLDITRLPDGGIRVLLGAEHERERRRMLYEREQIQRALKDAGYSSVDLRVRLSQGGAHGA